MARSEVLSRQTWSEKTDNFGDFSQSNCHDVHVLAVDDSLIDRKVIERLLKITSCKVTAVDSGIRALQYLGLDKLDAEKNSAGFDGLKVDMIITDYCMPGMTGYELLKKIKGSSTFRQVPVVIMSSENVLARIDRCLEEGAEDFIVKPVKLSDVKRLKDYMFGEDKSSSQKQETNKRKLSQISSESEISESSFSSSSPPPFISDSSTEYLSSLLSIDSATTTSSSPSPQSLSPSPSPQSLSPSPSPQSSSPSSPSLLTSPTRRLKMTNLELD